MQILKLKNKLSVIFVLIISSLLILNPIFISAQEIQIKNNLLAPHKTGELLVKLKSSEQIYKIKFSSQTDLNKLIQYYSNLEQVEYVEPNYTYQAALIPTDEFFGEQTYLREIGANAAWNITSGSQDIVVAVIDSGIDIDHPDLKNNIWTNQQEIANNQIDDDENGFTDDVHGWNFIGNNNDVKPVLKEGYSKTAVNHGTAVAGILGAQGNNKTGIAGVTWQAKIMPIKALDEQGIGDTQTVAKAIDYAREKGADIINLSFVGSGKSLTLEKAIKKAYQSGILVVAAAGNEVSQGLNMDETPAYPVCHDGVNGENWVIGVASVDSNNLLASFSNYGKNCVDLTAPGVGLYSAVFHQDNNSDFNKYYSSGWTGTSVSAPQVSGTLALLKTIRPDLSSQQIKQVLLDNTKDIDHLNRNYQGLLGSGKLDVFAAVSKSLSAQQEQNFELSKIISSPAINGGPHIRIFKKIYLENQFFAFEENFRSTLSIASADLDNNGEKEIIVGLGKGTYPWVKIFSQQGTLKNQFMAYDENMQAGVEIAVGDVDDDGEIEIITGYGSSPLVRIFNTQGILENEFYAFDKDLDCGLELAVGDVNNDNQQEILVVKKQGYPEVKIFDNTGLIVASFMAFDLNFKNGIHLATGDLDNNGQEEIIVGADYGNAPWVRIFDYNGRQKNEFLAYGQNFKGGVYVAVGDINDDGYLEIVTGAGPTGGPHVRAFNQNGQVKMQFFAYSENFRGGVRVATEK